jgi:hypothetical protein
MPDPMWLELDAATLDEGRHKLRGRIFLLAEAFVK